MTEDENYYETETAEAELAVDAEQEIEAELTAEAEQTEGPVPEAAESTEASDASVLPEESALPEQYEGSEEPYLSEGYEGPEEPDLPDYDYDEDLEKYAVADDDEDDVPVVLTKEQKKRRRRRKLKKLLRSAKLGSFALMCLLIVCAVAFCAWRLLWREPEGNDIRVTEEIPSVEYAYQASRKLLAGQTSKIAADALDLGIEDYLSYQRWMESHAAPTGDALTVSSCRIENGEVVFKVHGDRLIMTDDATYYLYGQEIYQSGMEGKAVASVDISSMEAAAEAYSSGSLEADSFAEAANSDGTIEFRFPLNKNTADSNLYRRFFVTVNYQGSQIAVSAKKYIENPSACAGYTVARNDHGKKGILPAAALIRSNGVAALGCQQAIYNMTLGSICAGGGISYTYNGRTYSFSASLISQYDIVVQRLNAQGVQITMVLLNDPAGISTMIHPDSRGGSGHYYAFNSKEKAGVEMLEAVVSFVTQRYSGTGHGTVDNWVVGNEVNCRADWNYMADVGLYNYTQAYADAFRIIYYAIKSQNGNARVYISLDQQWAASANSARYYSGRSFLSTFAEIMRKDGDLDWHVAVHPYNVPLTSPYAWQATSRAPHSQDAAYLTMRNIDVLTDYLCRADMLAPDGQVRSVLCSEQGYTSSMGEGIQAAAVVFGYLQAMHNSHIDGFILSREMDDAGEVAQGLANGLLNTAGGRKLAYSYYQAMGTVTEQQFVDSALALMGVTDLSTIITNR